MTPLDAAFDAVAIVFLLATMLYAYRLVSMTKDAEIVALSQPRTVFRLILVAFIFLFFLPFLSLINEILYPVPYLDPIQHLLVIGTAFLSVVAIYTAVYFYRTSTRKVQQDIRSRQS
ncbi:MAG TPA: hypothetical protein VFF30_07380 [Nitrososphaerales archaeon]|nr:hypothetical protein [Nitrososphaerales archaeon]